MLMDGVLTLVFNYTPVIGESFDIIVGDPTWVGDFDVVSSNLGGGLTVDDSLLATTGTITIIPSRRQGRSSCWRDRWFCAPQAWAGVGGRGAVWGKPKFSVPDGMEPPFLDSRPQPLAAACCNRRRGSLRRRRRVRKHSDSEGYSRDPVRSPNP